MYIAFELLNGSITTVKNKIITYCFKHGITVYRCTRSGTKVRIYVREILQIHKLYNYIANNFDIQFIHCCAYKICDMHFKLNSLLNILLKTRLITEEGVWYGNY